MTSICLYFQIHQPIRLKNYTFFQIGYDHQYDDVQLNYQILNKVADRCYLPVNALLLELIKKQKGKFKVAFSISGVALEQFIQYRPEVITSIRRLVDTGCVEILSETYYHSLSSVYSPEEFEKQVKKHRDTVKYLFDIEPTTFRNTELVYSDSVAKQVADMGYYDTILAEGAPQLIENDAASFVFKAGETDLNLLLRHYKLSDDIAFRFPDQSWEHYPLTPEKFAKWVHALDGKADTINLFMDYETFGEHKSADTGILEFLRNMPEAVLANENFSFLTPSETVKAYKVKKQLDVPSEITWADAERDLSGWNHNHMQKDAIQKLYGLEAMVKESKSREFADIFGRLQTSDHLYYMSTKYWNDGVRQTFSPYKSPYDAYIIYMNVLSDFEQLVKSSL